MIRVGFTYLDKYSLAASVVGIGSHTAEGRQGRGEGGEDREVGGCGDTDWLIKGLSSGDLER